jgi:hypothetical protein
MEALFPPPRSLMRKALERAHLPYRAWVCAASSTQSPEVRLCPGFFASANEAFRSGRRFADASFPEPFALSGQLEVGVLHVSRNVST